MKEQHESPSQSIGPGCAAARRGPKNYVAKRTSQGRAEKEIIRSPKRHITRQIYRALNPAHPCAHVLVRP
jgi:hypothetical protein